ncbi:MAG: ATP-binding cassette domain-containing protein, partial [Chlamydiales bacterium]|nr:ATP-binding cassette domain-containing protein [Chlamydiales bacterium]
SVNFDVPRGAVAVFLGGSGAGKTTLLRLLNNLDSLDEGEVALDGNILDMQKVSVDHTVGMVFQHFNLFEHLSVLENITLPLTLQGATKEAAENTALLLLTKYGLQDFAKKSVGKLSGGQKQRLAIARTQALNPKIICLDEPTSALDPLLTAQVEGFVQDLSKEGRIVLLTTHDMGLIGQLDCHIFFMQDGTIIERATTKSLRESPLKFPCISRYITNT